jgi:prefoldin subunit 5
MLQAMKEELQQLGDEVKSLQARVAKLEEYETEALIAESAEHLREVDEACTRRDQSACEHCVSI